MKLCTSSKTGSYCFSDRTEQSSENHFSLLISNLVFFALWIWTISWIPCQENVPYPHQVTTPIWSQCLLSSAFIPYNSFRATKHAFSSGITDKVVAEVNVVYFDRKGYTQGRSARAESTLGNAIASTLFLAIFWSNQSKPDCYYQNTKIWKISSSVMCLLY